MKKPLRWVGSKTWAVPLISELYKRSKGEYPAILEGFAGSAAVSFGVEPKKAYLNDMNASLINFYEALWAGYFSSHESVFIEDIEDYRRLRSAANNALRIDEPCLPEHFYALNRTCFNGLWRVNRIGEFNVPADTDRLGKALKAPTYPSFAMEVTCQDATTLSIPPDAFLFFDPPYFGTFCGYTASKYTIADFTSLLDSLASISNPIVITINPGCEELLARYGYEVEVVAGRKDRVSCKAETRVSRTEIIATRNIK